MIGQGGPALHRDQTGQLASDSDRGVEAGVVDGVGYVVRIIASAQVILAAAESGWSPNSPASCAAQPRIPNLRSVVATAWRTWSVEGDSEDWRGEANSASARTASNVLCRWYPRWRAFAVGIAIVLASLSSASALGRDGVGCVVTIALRPAAVVAASA